METKISKHFTKINNHEDIISVIVNLFFDELKTAPSVKQIEDVCMEYIMNPEGKDFFVMYEENGKWKSRFLSNDEITLVD